MGGDPKEMLLRHFEKVIAAAFGGWLLYTLAAFVAMKPPSLGQNDQIQTDLGEVEKHMRNWDVKLDPLPDNTKDLKKQLDPAEVSTVGPFGPWLYHRRPSFIFKPADGPKLVYPRANPPVEFHVAEKGRRRVSLAWKLSGENEHVKILRFDLLRKDGEQGEWKVIDSISGDKTDYTDTTVSARAKYWYRLTQHADTDTDDPVIVHDKTTLPDTMHDLNADDIPDAVETPQDVYITIDGGQKPDPTKGDPEKDDAAKGSIDFKVWRWHAGLNLFVSKGYRGVLMGKKLGALDAHYPIQKGKTESVDFSTDAELEDVDVRKVQLPHMPAPVDRVVAKVKWPWGEEELIQGQDPPEIDAQKKKK
jgi:hypothetical protein